MIKVLFICHGNICRSPMAEFYFKKLVTDNHIADCFYIASAATSTEEIGNDIHYGTKDILEKYNISFERRHARQITRQDYDEFDYIIGMDSRNMKNIHRICGGDPNEKIFPLMSYAGISRDVADPWYTGDFETTYRDVQVGCKAFLDYLHVQEHKDK